MQEFIFKYDASYEPNRTIAFEYNYKRFNELWLSYKRICSICNTALFNKPVAAEKAATGFFDIPALWLEKFITFQIDNNEFVYNVKDITPFIIKNIFIAKENYWSVHRGISVKKIINTNLIDNNDNEWISRFIYTDIYQQYHAAKDTLNFNINKDYMGRLKDKYVHINKDILVKDPLKLVSVNEQIYLTGYKYKYANLSNIKGAITGNKYGILNKSHNIIASEKQVSLYNGVDINKQLQYDASLYRFIPFLINSKKGLVINQFFVSRGNKKGSVLKNEFSYKEVRKRAFIQSIKPFTTSSRIVAYFPINSWAFDLNYYARMHNDEFAIKAMDNTRGYTSDYSVFIPVNNKGKNVYIETVTIPYYKYKNLSDTFHDNVWTSHERYDMSIKDTITNALVSHKDLLFYNDPSFAEKIYKALHIFSENGHFSHKDLYSMNFISSNDISYVSKERYSLYHVFADTWANRTSKIIMMSDLFTGLFRKQYSVSTNDTDLWIFRKLKDLSFYINGKYDMYLVPAVKESHGVFTDIIDEFVHKALSGASILITQDMFASKVKKYAHLSNEQLFCDKESHALYIEYMNYWVIKDKISSFIYDNQLWVNKDRKSVYMDIHSWVQKDKKASWIAPDEWTSKDRKKMSIFDDQWLQKEGKSMWIPKDEWLSKDHKAAWYDKDYWSSKESDHMNTYKQEWVDKERDGVKIADFSWANKTIGELNNPDCDLFTTKTLYGVTLFEEINNIEKQYKDCRADDHIGEWVWAYETPDPFENDEFGIDELLLPEEDIRYSDLEDIIFDREKMRPKNPVKKIDDNTWIAKFPTKHPLFRDDKRYDEGYYKIGSREYTGKYYTGVIIDQYYGVRTSIMHEIYLQFYTIWQAHLFEFAMMPMVKSLKLMLEYLYSWIIITYDKDSIAEALRVYKQIRWFGECAVLDNSQYVITFEMDDLRSNLHTGGCSIPNNLNKQDTMYIDPSPNICAIKNNPAYIGASEAYVEFYINLRYDSAIHFDLYNPGHSANIYIDGVLVDVITTSGANNVYELHNTGETITFKIELDKANNIDRRFGIMNIIVEKASFKNLDVQFDPVLKAGNKPMDEIARKMLQYANLYDNIDEAYENIKKANTGISVTMDQMLQYWEHHHAGKTKGKRLTIKKT